MRLISKHESLCAGCRLHLLTLQSGHQSIGSGNRQRVDAEFRNAVCQGDASGLSQIFADDIVIVHSDGDQDTRENFLDAIATGRLKMISYQRNDVQIRIYGAVAIMSSKTSKTFAYKGNPGKAADTSIVTFAKIKNSWRIVAMQNTPRTE